jgi:prepilin-type N-terminal cleavage/methylation domain-containing protein
MRSFRRGLIIVGGGEGRSARRVRRARRGFTLVEIIVVMIVVGILMRIAVGGSGDTTNQAIETAMLQDLRAFYLKAEQHKYTFRTYPSSVQAAGTETAANMTFGGSDGVVLTITGATSTRYTVTATHPQLPGRSCALAVAPNGSARPVCTGTVT